MLLARDGNKVPSPLRNAPGMCSPIVSPGAYLYVITIHFLPKKVLPIQTDFSTCRLTLRLTPCDFRDLIERKINLKLEIVFCAYGCKRKTEIYNLDLDQSKPLWTSVLIERHQDLISTATKWTATITRMEISRKCLKDQKRQRKFYYSSIFFLSSIYRYFSYTAVKELTNK